MFSGQIKYGLIISAILLTLFLSQQPFLEKKGESLTAQVSAPVQEYMTKGSSWVKDKIIDKVGDEVTERGEKIKEDVTQTKENISDNVSEKIKNYFSEVVDKVIKPEKKQNNQSCECP